MKFLRNLRSVKTGNKDARGLDWVAVTAAVVSLGQVVMTVVGSGVTGLGDAVVIDRRSGRPG